jgi:hypothetical protein
MKLWSLIILALVLVGGMLSYHYSPLQVRKRAVMEALEVYKEAVATKEREKVLGAFDALLADDAQVRLEIHFFAIANRHQPMEQKFDKAQFLTFIDNIIYSLKDYGSSPKFAALDAVHDEVSITSGEWGEGTDMMGGLAIDMRYSLSSECKGLAVFEPEPVKLKSLDCKVTLAQMPKPGQEGRLSKGSIMQMIEGR